ncbi:hypothetical protein QA649_08950 [Bradyrhizobium sp. CB1717]|uniref:hypothetical protein n=1 Tax=Bradyrhizobium sp. CB1717 TaxID=3039154 RepID=UPI0024B0873C|nr:hypothetical protein [Bradyrhizobium sp. CB1717]WFU26318.1 hypothetical protein QA649_08950 [Bradyrhizobium sp. CB1717]
MADFGQFDTSLYRDAMNAGPFDFQNQLLATQRARQEVELNNIKLATERFGMVNNAASGLLADPDLGTKDVTGKLWDTLGRLTKGDAMTAQHAVQFMQGFPSDPRMQAQAIRNVHGQTLDAWQKGKAYIGETEAMATGGGNKLVGLPSFKNYIEDRGYVPNTLPPGQPTINSDPNSPNYGRETTMGTYGNPPIQPPAAAPAVPARAPRVAAAPAAGGAVPAANGAPARAKVPSSAKVVGDEEGVKSGVYEAPSFNDRFSAARPVTKLAPGEETALTGAAQSYNEAMTNAGRYAQRINPLRQSIPILERMRPEDIGPLSDRWNEVKSTAQSLGAGKLAGIDPEKIKDYNELKKYFTQYASQAAATLGPKTNDGLATAVTSNPNVHMDKLSATELAKVALGIERMQQAAALEFNDLVQAGKAQPGTFNRFMLQWATKQDPRAFVYDIMDKKGQEAVRKLPEAEREKVKEGMRIAEKWKLLGDVHRE